MCGFKNSETPPPWVYSRFLDKLMEKEHQEYIEEIFNNLIEELKELLSDFGEKLAVDGKAIESYANPHDYDQDEKEELKNDRRRDLDAKFGRKDYYYKDEHGNKYETTKRWFGYKLHLIVDAEYELPVSYKVITAEKGESPIAHEMIDELKQTHPDLRGKCKYLLGDRGYDGGKLIKKCWDEYRIKPIIDIRDMWKDGEDSRVLEDEENVVYDYCGNVYCYDPDTGLKKRWPIGVLKKSETR